MFAEVEIFVASFECQRMQKTSSLIPGWQAVSLVGSDTSCVLAAVTLGARAAEEAATQAVLKGLHRRKRKLFSQTTRPRDQK